MGRAIGQNAVECQCLARQGLCNRLAAFRKNTLQPVGRFADGAFDRVRACRKHGRKGKGSLGQSVIETMLACGDGAGDLVGRTGQRLLDAGMGRLQAVDELCRAGVETLGQALFAGRKGICKRICALAEAVLDAILGLGQGAHQAAGLFGKHAVDAAMGTADQIAEIGRAAADRFLDEVVRGASAVASVSD